MKIKKVFYTVIYTRSKFDRPRIMWFDNLEEAEKFAKYDYRVKPVKHVYTSEKTIEMAEELIELQKTLKNI